MSDHQNPYQPPAAEPQQSRSLHRSRISLARRVRARRGVAWLNDGMNIVMQGTAGFVLVYLFMLIPYGVSLMLAYALQAIDPRLTAIATLLMAPIFTVFWGGMMAGCEQRPFKAGCALGAMRANFVPLFVLGVFSNLFLVLMIAFAASLAGAGFDSLDAMNGGTIVAVILAGFALFACFLSAVWFSPALVAIGQVRPRAAMSRSVTACFKNFLPFSVLTIMAIVLLVAFSLLLALVSGIALGIIGVAGSLEFGSAVAALQIGVGLLINFLVTGLLIALFAGTQYSSFHDVFVYRGSNGAP